MIDLIQYAVSIITCIIGVLGYQRFMKQDTQQYTKDMTRLMTKVDILLQQSSKLTLDVQQHGELLVKHDVKIKDMEKNINMLRSEGNDKSFKK